MNLPHRTSDKNRVTDTLGTSTPISDFSVNFPKVIQGLAWIGSIQLGTALIVETFLQERADLERL